MNNLDRALLSLDGLSVGDALGERFFGTEQYVSVLIRHRELPAPPWRYTDDTEMALAIVDELKRAGQIDQDQLAAGFARRYARNDRRGYGAGAHAILQSLNLGLDWRDVSRRVFGGDGSLGNGGAMRVAPLGGFFAQHDDIVIIEQARRSAEVTHAHAEGQAGAIAVAVAAAWAWRHRDKATDARSLFDFVISHTPDGPTRDGIVRAAQLGDCSVEHAARKVGNGSRVTAPDTVPLCLWIASRHPRDFVEAMWQTVSAGGDIDTNCAIVGGIVALSTGQDTIPGDWLAAREPLV